MTTAKRRMAVLVAVSAVSGVMTLFAPATGPAQAIPHEECVVLGNLSLSSGFYSPVGNALVSPTQPSSAHSAVFAVGGGLCLPSLAIPSATGIVHGWCGLSFGSGISNAGADFHWIEAGPLIELTGELSGAMSITRNIPAGESCLNHTPGARHFLADGSWVQHSCTVLNSPSQSVPRGASASVSAGPGNHAHAHIKPGSIHGRIRTSVASASASAFHNDFHVGISVCA